ncbi:MAG: fibronectin type III domain-containing protein [Desulfobacterales bacterium]
MRGRLPAFAALLLALLLPQAAAALDFLFSWRADPDPGLVGYAVFGRTGDADWAKIEELPLSVFEDPAQPAFLVTGLSSGATYRFAVSALYAGGTKSALYDETCVRVGDAIFDCREDGQDGTTFYMSCFLSAASGSPGPEGGRRREAICARPPPLSPPGRR